MRKARAAALAARVVVAPVPVSQIERFERWRRRQRHATAHLITLILDEVVPLFQARGFNRYADYAGATTFAVGPNCIPLQRRSGAEWPTVELVFDKRGRSALGVDFATLPEVCRRVGNKTWIEIPRPQACVAEGPGVFSLSKGHHSYNDRNFGYYYFSFGPERKLRTEVDILKSLLPWLFDRLDLAIPQAWLSAPQGYVDDHAFLISSWRILDQRLRRGAAR